ncbi:tetratricopeptide repeat protein [Pseudotenacibaculum sp. MALMAid0570]
MKTKVLALCLGLASLATFAQKNEIKAAEKALKKQDITTAMTALTAAEPLISNAPKLASKFYFLKGQAYAAKKDFKVAAEAYNKLFDVEKKAGRLKYTDQAKPLLEKLMNDIVNEGFAHYEAKNFKKASESFYMRYSLNNKDTLFLSNAAQTAFQADDLETSLKHYKELKKIGYTGIATTYLATNKETGVVENMGGKKQRDLVVKYGTHNNPQDKVSESKRGDVIKNIGIILTRQGKVDEAMVAVQEARKANPDDMSLLFTEADLYLKLKKMDKFGELMEEAIKNDPNNPILYYNLGVVNYNENKYEDAKKYYKKAIELKPDYYDAHMNMAVAILEKEKEIVEEMNKNLSDFDKYDALVEKQKQVYKDALPYLEKADKGARSIDTVRTLLNIYETLEMEDKAKVYRELYKTLRSK